MRTVRLDFSPAPTHVRTARLVAVAVARRAGVADELLDEIRLAVGEACSRAVALHQKHSIQDLVEVEITDGARFTVRVYDRAPTETQIPRTSVLDPDDLVVEAADLSAAEPFVDTSVGVGLALLTGLVDDLSVAPRTDGPGNTVSMSWAL